MTDVSSKRSAVEPPCVAWPYNTVNYDRQVTSKTRKRLRNRKYGQALHRNTRKALVPIVAAGGVNCARCGEPIWPEEPWDLGHVDGDKIRYPGPEHRACNRATATHKAKRRRRVQVAFVGENSVTFSGDQSRRRTSRNW